MTVTQFYEHLEKKGISRNQYIRRVSLLFFAADLAQKIASDLDGMMAPYGAIDGNIKGNVSKIHQYSSNLIRRSDDTLKDDRVIEFANDGDRFTNIAFGWAGIIDEKPFLFSDLKSLLDSKFDNGLRVITVDEIKRIVQDIELKIKTL